MAVALRRVRRDGFKNGKSDVSAPNFESNENSGNKCLARTTTKDERQTTCGRETKTTRIQTENALCVSPAFTPGRKTDTNSELSKRFNNVTDDIIVFSRVLISRQRRHFVRAPVRQILFSVFFFCFRGTKHNSRFPGIRSRCCCKTNNEKKNTI